MLVFSKLFDSETSAWFSQTGSHIGCFVLKLDCFASQNYSLAVPVVMNLNQCHNSAQYTDMNYTSIHAAYQEALCYYFSNRLDFCLVE